MHMLSLLVLSLPRLFFRVTGNLGGWAANLGGVTAKLGGVTRIVSPVTSNLCPVVSNLGGVTSSTKESGNIFRHTLVGTLSVHHVSLGVKLKLFLLWSQLYFCSYSAHLKTPPLSSNRCAAPARLST